MGGLLPQNYILGCSVHWPSAPGTADCGFRLEHSVGLITQNNHMSLDYGVSLGDVFFHLTSRTLCGSRSYSVGAARDSYFSVTGPSVHDLSALKGALHKSKGVLQVSAY